MSRLKVFLLTQDNINDGNAYPTYHPIGYTTDEDFAERWQAEHPYYRNFEEIKEIKEKVNEVD